MPQGWPDLDLGLCAAVPLIGDLVALADRLGDDDRVRRLLRDLVRLDGPALISLSDKLHERVRAKRAA